MNCPVDGTTLAITERSGVEIDYCPQCRGVWLDRGELDKIIDRAEQLLPSAPPAQPQHQQPQPPPQQPYRDDRYDPRYNQGHQQHGHYKKKKKGGFLGEMFDFD